MNTATLQNKNPLVVQRRRRHFREDFKKQVLADIQVGKLHIKNVKDQYGNAIAPLIVERWKDQLRTEDLSAYKSVPKQKPVAAEMADLGDLAKAVKGSPSTAFFADLVLKMAAEMAELKFQNMQLKDSASNTRTRKVSA